MFFDERVKSIKPEDRVLEIGPGGTPHPRADILLDINPNTFPDEIAAGYQRGNAPKLRTDKPLIYYDGKKFPFKDCEFDYVICSHVLEHVEDLSGFLKEVFRIAKRGYFEYPTIYYEYLYSIPVHLNILRRTSSTIYYIKKEETALSDFQQVQSLLLVSLEKGYSSLVNELKEVMFEGYEWDRSLKLKHTKKIADLIEKDFVLQPAKVVSTPSVWEYRTKTLQKIVFVKVAKRLIPQKVRRDIKKWVIRG